MSDKRPLAWHRDCLRNATEFCKRERALAELALARCEHNEAEIQHYAEQIAEAERRGLDGFDRKRFMQKRERKAGNV